MAYKQFLPYFASGKINKGFGRGSAALGIPTANYPEDVVSTLPAEFDNGIYYGWAGLEGSVYKMVLSIGWNPFFKNIKKSMEVHILHKFSGDLYGKQLNIIITGFIRLEKDFSSLDDLIAEIKNDIKIADDKLNDEQMLKYKNNDFL
ncbi:riboflavin kinase, partial [Aphidius gifuensis]|uniref:riboflavin kinase n=1 Tax=Aphidius gifuensis TaxID=684658 RepID=UPI001CDC4941